MFLSYDLWPKKLFSNFFCVILSKWDKSYIFKNKNISIAEAYTPVDSYSKNRKSIRYTVQ